jgi:predicted transcriptional regulator
MTKQEQAYALRVAGYTLEEIAEGLGETVEDVQEMLLAAGESRGRKSAEALRISTQLEVDRLDVMLKAVWPGVQAGDLGSIDRAVKLLERRSKMLGLDAPEVRAQLSVQLNDNTDLSKLTSKELRTLLELQAKMSGGETIKGELK